jgi:hypothetical protein
MKRLEQKKFIDAYQAKDISLVLKNKYTCNTVKPV